MGSHLVQKTETLPPGLYEVQVPMSSLVLAEVSWERTPRTLVLSRGGQEAPSGFPWDGEKLRAEGAGETGAGWVLTQR